jgi:two-component system, NtrC family, response regulator HydG
MTVKGSILIVEDEQAHGEAMAEGLNRAGFECTVVHSGEEAYRALNERPFDVIITDYRLGGRVDGMDVLREAKTKWSEAEVVLITAHGNEQLARTALRKERAYDYLTKPIDLEELRDVVGRAAKQAQASRENLLLRRQLDDRMGFENIIAASPEMRRILRIVKQVAGTNITVLLQGESGTGKDLIAGAIHQNSPRRTKRMVALDCAGLSEGVLESELFGHVKGAFTGAIAGRKGRFEYADGSTLFLDEIGEMPAAMQAKLLRVLETREFVPVGSNEPVSVDVRLISATNRDLGQMVREKGFREDLYFRIKGVSLKIPPLRERREDIPLLMEHFLRTFGEEHGKKIEGVSPTARNLLVNYHWPGNVRELRNVIESMVVLTDKKTLDVDDVPEELRAQSSETRTTAIVPLTSLAGKSLQELEKEHIRNTLQLTKGNREQAANILGIAPRTLYRKLKEYDLT